MKIPKKVVAGIIGAATTVLPIIGDIVSEKMKQKSEKQEQERIYANQKHNGMVKIASVVFLLISLVLSILAMKQSRIILGIIGILSAVAYTITSLYCLDIINEKRHNSYKIVFMVGNMLMIIVATLLFF